MYICQQEGFLESAYIIDFLYGSMNNECEPYTIQKCQRIMLSILEVIPEYYFHVVH